MLQRDLNLVNGNGIQSVQRATASPVFAVTGPAEQGLWHWGWKPKKSKLDTKPDTPLHP